MIFLPSESVTMLKLWIASILFIAGVLLQKQGLDLLKFRQNDYKVIPERLELVRYNNRIVKYATLVTYKYNRTSPAVNGSFIANVDVKNDLEVMVQAYKFLSNEYRYFPIRFQVNLCDSLKQNVMGIGNIHCGNFSGCPITKDKLYSICKFTINDSYLPPLIPSGKYMIEFQGLLHGQDAGLVRGYATVDRPFTKK